MPKQLNGLINFKETPNQPEEIDNILHPYVKKWFYSRFSSYSLPQLYGVMEIHSRNNILVSAPTGATKTLTGFLSILNELVDSAEKGILQDKVYCVYISPLKALNYDIQLNLIEPLKEIEAIAGKRLGIRVGVRTGDTTAAEKQQMLKHPPHILITTPESLALMLTAPKFREHLKTVEWMIVDEIHALAENKRGVHLSLSMERLSYLSQHITRIGLSACLHYDEYITLVDGSITKIGELIEDLLIKYKKHGNGLEYANTKNLKVFCLNEQGKIVTAKVSRVWKIPSPPKIAEVTLATRKKIKITLNDKFLTLKKGKLCWQRVDQSKEGDLIAIPKRIIPQNKQINLFDYLKNSNCIYTIADKDQIKKITGNYAKKNNLILKDVAKQLNINHKKLEHLRAGFTKTLSIRDFSAIYSLNPIYFKKIEHVCGTTGKHLIKIPKFINTDFMRLFGLIAADGHVNKGIITFANNNKNLINEVVTLFIKLFGRKPYVRKHSPKKNKSFIVTFKSIPLSFIFKELGLNFGKKARTMRINHNIMSLSEDNLSSFISGYLDGDGAINNKLLKGGYLRLHSYSKGFINDLYHLFVRLGIHPSIIKTKRKFGHLYYLQVTSAENRQKLFGLLKRSIKAKKLKNNFEEERRNDFLPIGDMMYDYKLKRNLFYKRLDEVLGIYSHDLVTRGYGSKMLIRKMIENLKVNSFLRKKLETILNYDISFEKIKKIKIIKNDKDYVYDLSVEPHHNFIASNIIVHNTIAPLEDVAAFLVGLENGNQRPCKIVDVQFIKQMDLQVMSPVPDLIDVEHALMHHAMYELIDKLIQEHKTTLIFTNTRSATERVVDHLKEKFPSRYTENIGAHHGSLSAAHRRGIEKQLREGKLRVCVSSTSLELGIDIGYIDLVICLGSPKSVARFLQRGGRSGHRLHEKVKGRIIVLDRDDLVECSVLLKVAIEKKIDKIHIPLNALDVLAQQIHGLCLEQVWKTEDLYKLIRQSYCYKDLKKEDFMEIIEFLSGRFASLEDRNVYAKIWYDEENGEVGKKGKMSRVIYMTNIGTIPDESFVIVKVGEQVIGKLDEAFLERLKRGDVFVLGGEQYEFLYSKGMTAQVRPSYHRPPNIPSWFSEMLPLSFDLAIEIGKFRRLMEEKLKKNLSKEEIIKFLNEYLYVDQNSANAIYEYFKDQYDYAKEIPNDKKILVEHYEDQYGKKIIFHSLYGRRVNDVLSRAVAFAISRSQHRDVEIGISDNGFYITADKTIHPLSALKLIKSEKLELIMKNAIDMTEVLKRRFRHCASRAFMILRSYMGKTKRVGRQQVSSMLLMNAVKRISNDFSILKEARREVLEDLMDIENTKKIIAEIEQGKITIKEIHTKIPTPFAFNLALQGYVDVLKIEEKIEFLRRMHQMVKAKIGLGR